MSKQVVAAIAVTALCALLGGVVIGNMAKLERAETYPVPRAQPFSVEYTIQTQTGAAIMYVTMPGTPANEEPARCLVVVSPDGSTSIGCVR